VLRSQVERLTLDPSWVVPPTILRNDVLPKLRRDPAYLARNHLRVFDAAGRALDASTIRWAQPPAGLIVRQDPGPSGALGVVAFRFSNTHQVYLHDTPHQALFERTPRAFSSGCVRVEHALELARLLLNEPMQWSEAALQTATEEGVTRSVILDHPVPLWMIYWTVRVHQDGSVSLLPDIYTQDSALRDNLARTLAAQQLAFSRP
jgi:murein L,D-transpeptidase YcbB/YkuD